MVTLSTGLPRAGGGAALKTFAKNRETPCLSFTVQLYCSQLLRIVYQEYSAGLHAVNVNTYYVI